MTYNTYTTYTANGSTTDFAIPFPYDSVDEIKVFVGTVLTSFTLVNPGLLRLASPPTSGSVITVRRQTDLASPVVSFIENKNVLGGPANNQVNQLIKGIQEIADTQQGQGNRGQTGLPGPAGPAGPAANFLLFRSKEVVEATNIPTFLAGGPEYIRTAGYSEPGDAGDALYKRVSSEPGHAGKVQSSDGAWWEYVVTGSVKLEQFGGKADNSTANDAAFTAAVSIVKSLPPASYYTWGGPCIELLDGIYYFANTINIRGRTVNIRGQIPCNANGGTSAMRWPANTVGVFIDRPDTNMGVVVPNSANNAGDGSTFQNIFFIGGGGSARGTAHGVESRARFTMFDCAFRGFAGDAIHIQAESGGGDQYRGNANSWKISRVTIQQTGRHGLFVDGDNANAGLCDSFEVLECGGCGIYDSTFLGNTYVAPGIHSCGWDGKWIANHNGSCWQLINGNENGAAIAPGTDIYVWQKLGPTDPDRPNWSSSGDYEVGSPIFLGGSGGNARGVVIGAYVEGGFGGMCVVEGRSMMIGGQVAGGVSDGSIWLNSEWGFIASQTGVGQSGRIASDINKIAHVKIGADHNIGSPQWNQEWMTFGYSHDGEWRLMGDGNGSAADIKPDTSFYQAGQERYHWVATGLLTTQDFGTGAAQPGVFWVQKLAIGDPAIGQRRVSYGSAAPSSGAHAQGEVVFNLSPTPGGFVGWVCTTGGTPGTWKTFGAVSA